MWGDLKLAVLWKRSWWLFCGLVRGNDGSLEGFHRSQSNGDLGSCSPRESSRRYKEPRQFAQHELGTEEGPPMTELGVEGAVRVPTQTERALVSRHQRQSQNRNVSGNVARTDDSQGQNSHTPYQGLGIRCNFRENFVLVGKQWIDRD